MLVRFVLCEPRQKIARGLFCVTYTLGRDPAVDEWLRVEIQSQTDWFNRHLPVPTRFCVVSRRTLRPDGICWFYPEAVEHIARARELARLVAEARYITGELRTQRPGQVLYRDAFQVVAKPSLATPVVV